MSTTPRNRDSDRVRINIGEKSEISYWAQQLGVSNARLIEAVNKVGDNLNAVRRELVSRASK